MLIGPEVRQNKAVLFISALIVVGLLAYSAIVVFEIGFFQSLPYWFIVPHKTPVNFIFIVVALLFLLIAIAFFHLSRTKAINLLLIFVAGVAIQFSFGLAKGGVDSISSRMILTGHAQFMRMALKIDNIADFIRDYEKLVKENKLGFFAPSKPPGTAIVYVLTDRVVNYLNKKDKQAEPTVAERESKLVNFATYCWTVFSCLPIFLIYLLGRRLFDSKTAMFAALLYATVPSVALINLHTDQTFYPFMAVLTVFLMVKAKQEHNLWLAVLTGIIFFLTSFLSFGLLVTAILFIWIIFIHNISRQSIILSGAVGLGILLTGLVFYWSFQYNHIERYLSATAYHVSVKGWDNSAETLFFAAGTNLIEYCLWIGLPLAILAIYAFKNISILKSTDDGPLNAVLTSFFLIIIALLFFGKTKAETARLWMFLTPFMCLFAAQAVKELARSDRVFMVFSSFVLVAQFLAAYLLLRYQDFL
jgi:4-amino-4-deoxy-L-arabinose transferase-like glycosyltransferase